jgi:hypothetical protein
MLGIQWLQTIEYEFLVYGSGLIFKLTSNRYILQTILIVLNIMMYLYDKYFTVSRF